MTTLLRRLRQIFTINSSRVYLDQFVAAAGESIQPTQRILDAGAGEGWYRRHFHHAHYEGIDFGQIDKIYGDLDCISDLTAIPLADSSYDLILCTQVLEHLPYPGKALAEMNRLLKPGGRLWLSTPLFYQEHEIPYDYYRYTRYGLERLLLDTGFELERVEWLEGYFGTISYQWRALGRSLSLANGRRTGNLIRQGLFLLAQPLRVAAYFLAAAFSWLDLAWKETEIGYPKNYSVVASKPSQGAVVQLKGNDSESA
jgi:SAM-dependent methyltransferase